MKTAMQELIEDINIAKNLGIISLFSANKIIETINEIYIEKEKEQIMNAWQNKRMKVFLSDDTGELIILESNDGENYYNETYNQNK